MIYGNYYSVYDRPQLKYADQAGMPKIWKNTYDTSYDSNYGEGGAYNSSYGGYDPFQFNRTPFNYRFGTANSGKPFYDTGYASDPGYYGDRKGYIADQYQQPWKQPYRSQYKQLDRNFSADPLKNAFGSGSTADENAMIQALQQMYYEQGGMGSAGMLGTGGALGYGGSGYATSYNNGGYASSY